MFRTALGATAVVLASLAIWPASEARAQCAPAAVGAVPSNATVNCNGAVTNQNAPDGYGTGQQSNDIINVQTGSVTGTSSGFNIRDNNTVNLSNGTTITGGVNGISEAGLGTLTLNNTGGTVSGNGANGAVNGVVTPGSLTGTNGGTISAVSTAANGSALAVNPSTAVNLTNSAGANITATANGGEAVGLQSNVVTFTNSGTMTVSGGTNSGSFGVFGLTSVNVTNNASISVDDTGGVFEAAGVVSNGTLTLINNANGSIMATGTNADAVLSAGATSVTNAGTITGALDGVNTATSATTTIINSGTIAGTSRQGIRVNTAAITNNTNGLITGVTGIFFRAGNGASTVFDAGTITGTGGTAIQFSTGSTGNTLTLAPGFAVNGNVLGAGADVLQLGGTGSGAFNLSTIGAANQYQGFTTFNVVSGSWVVSGTFGQTQAWNVNGGVLEGTGTLKSVNVNNGGTLAPGTPGVPGTSMTINGNLAFQSGAIYLVQLNPSSTTMANVSGTATLAGNVLAAFAPGSYLTKQYTILHSAGLSGSFASLGTTNLPANFTASLSSTATDVFLNLTANLGTPPGPLPLGTNGLTINQLNVATSINNFFNGGGKLTPNFLNIFGLTGGNLAAALSQLSGEAATDGQTGAFQLMTEFLGVMIDPTVDGRSGPGSGGAMGFAPDQQVGLPPEIALAYARAVKAPPLTPVAFDQRWTVWGSGFGGYNKTSGDPVIGSNDVATRTFGFAGGADYHITRDALIGFALAGGGTNWGLAQGLGSGRSDAFQAGIYGKSYFGPAYIAASFAFTNSWMTTNRVAPFGDQLTARFNAQSFGGRLEGGYRVAVLPTVGITPYAAVQAQNFHTPTFSEIDLGGGFGLTFNGRNATDTRSELGARFDDLTLLGTMPLILRARAAWAHDWVSNPSLNAVFETLPGAGFTVNGAAPAKERALTTVGADLHVAANWVLAAKFEGEFASRSQTYAGTGTVRYTW
jgi:uncharacterized protein with beta-barrel porin domain